MLLLWAAIGVFPRCVRGVARGGARARSHCRANCQLTWGGLTVYPQPSKCDRRARCHTLRRPLRAPFYLIAQPPHDPDGLPDVRFAESDAHRRGDRQEAGVELAVAHVTSRRKLHQLRAPVFRIVDELDESRGRKLIRQPLHALTARWPHVGDLRHGQWTKQREATHEAERTAAPAGDEPCLLAERPYPEEALGHFEHQFGDRLGLAVDD